MFMCELYQFSLMREIDLIRGQFLEIFLCISVLQAHSLQDIFHGIINAIFSHFSV